MKKYILVIDEGTTGVRTMIFDKKLNNIASAYEKLTLIYPDTNYVEQSAEEIYEKTVSTMRAAVKKAAIEPEEIECIGISTQRVTWVPWRRDNAKPVMNMVTWMDRRGIETFKQLKADKHFERDFPQQYKALQPQQIICSMRFVLEHHPEIKTMMDRGELMFGTVDTWITYKLTGEKVFASNASNASTTRLLDNETCQWNSGLLSYLGFNETMFAEIKNESDDYGVLDKAVLGVEIPITGMAADQQSALFAQGCITPYSVKSTNGTGSFVSFNLGEKYMGGRGAYSSLVAWKLDSQLHYMAEGFLPTAGAALEWAKNEMHLFDSFDELAEMMERTPDSNGVYFSPALSGFRAPLNEPTARGAFMGLSPSVRSEHCVRAILEAIAFANIHIIEDVCEQFEIDQLDVIKISGGVSRSELLGQMIANVTGTKVVKPTSLEASAIGAAMFAGLYTGTYQLDSLQELIEIEKEYKPDELCEQHKQHYAAWKEAIKRTLNWTL